MESILINGNTHPGMQRSANQDASIMRPLRTGDKMLAAVIDGVGGYAGGERAAAIAKDCIERYMQTPSGDTLTMLREAVVFANNQIAKERKNEPRLGEMCCVLTTLVADKTLNQLYFVHVGDTRLYRYRNHQLQKLTLDHSLVGIREDAGEISEEEAMQHPHRNQILREVGSAVHRLDDEDFLEYGSDDFLPGDLLLLCSDGLTDMVTAAQLIEVLDTDQSLASATSQLIDLANEQGGHDNITVVLLQYPAAAGEVTIEKKPVKRVQKKPVASTISNNKKGEWKKTSLLTALLLLILIAGAGWYFATPKNVWVPDGSRFILSRPADSIQPDSNLSKPAGRASHAAIPGPAAVEKADTLRISATQNFADLKKYTDSTGKELVLVPEKTGNNHFAAISITSRSAKAGDTLLLKNLRLAGFENGIDIHLPILLKTENLAFENTVHPFRNLFKPDEKHASILLMNTAK